jgi:hypothetical protein
LSLLVAEQDQEQMQVVAVRVELFTLLLHQWHLVTTQSLLVLVVLVDLFMPMEHLATIQLLHH